MAEEEGRSKVDAVPESVLEKYAEEREKRLRPDGVEQYVEVAADFSHYVDDPYVEPGFSREPFNDEVEVVLIGGGYANLIAAVRLRQAGFTDLRLIDKAGDFGGTWYWNRYPGAMCDIESYIYMPLLEELGYTPEWRYAFAPEIRAHAQTIAREHDLYRNACLQTGVTEVRWDESTARWTILTDRDDHITARFVIMANGVLHRPKLPGIPGINSFKGYTFHTSRWDFRYTGGDESGNLTGLTDKRVGIIGTGATAVQCVPHLGEWAKQLYVFQRTPSSVDVRNNHKTDLEWTKTLQPGWQQERMENFTATISGGRPDVDLVDDGWTKLFRLFADLQDEEAKRLGRDLTPAERASLRDAADLQMMESIRARVESVVEDKATAEALKPWYGWFCKRPCYHDEYLPTFNRPNVALIDTNGRGVEQLTENAVVVNGQEYEVDCLVFATGFEVGTDYTRRAGYEVIGRDGVSMSDRWADGPRTLHGLESHAFPNCFFLGTTQTAITFNYLHAASEQVHQIVYILEQIRERDARTVEVTADAEADWVAEMQRLAHRGERYFANCTPGYINNEGKILAPNAFLSNSYGAGPVRFFRLLADWRAKGDLEGLEVR